MTMLTRCGVMSGLIFLLVASADAGPRVVRQEGTIALAQGAVQPEQQDEFVPIEELPPQDQLPAAPLLVAAYAFVMLALFGYLLSVARRLGSVQRELERLESDVKKNARS